MTEVFCFRDCHRGSSGSHANVCLIYLLHYWYWSAFSVNPRHWGVMITPSHLETHRRCIAGMDTITPRKEMDTCRNTQSNKMFSFCFCRTAEQRLLHSSSKHTRNKLSLADIATTTKQEMPNPPLHRTDTQTHTHPHRLSFPLLSSPPPPPLSLRSWKPEQTDKQTARDGLILPQWEMAYDENQARMRQRGRGWETLHGDG